MAAPDYVSQVRGAIDSLRENYIKKQQLFQQEQQAAQNLALNYAQLAANRENAQRQADLEGLRIEASKVNALADAEKLRFTQERQLASEQIERDRLDLLEKKELEDAAIKRQKAEADKTAGVLENRLRIAYEKNDPNEIATVLGELASSAVDTTDRIRLQQNARQTVEWKRSADQQELNLRTEPLARQIIDETINLNPSDYTPREYRAKLEENSKKFRDLKNNDDGLLRSFATVLQNANENGVKYVQSEIGSTVDQFQDLGEQNLLEPEDQKAYNALKAKPETFTVKAIQGLAFKRNFRKSVAELKAQDARNVQVLNFLKDQYPTLADKNLSPYLPDLSPSVGEDGLIDPNTGLLSKRFDAIQKDFDRKYTGGSFITGTAVPTMERFMAQAGMYAPAPAPAPTTNKPAAMIVPVQSRSNFEVALEGKTVVPSGAVAGATGPTATIPVAPTTVRVSPQTISEVVAIYTTNPNGTYAGRPVREIIAKLQASGVQLPGINPQAVVRNPEQTR